MSFIYEMMVLVRVSDSFICVLSINLRFYTHERNIQPAKYKCGNCYGFMLLLSPSGTGWALFLPPGM